MALGTQPVGKLRDYEQYIEHQLRRTRSRIKTTDVITAGLVLVTCALGVLFLEVILDHVFGLPVWLRRVILWGGTLGSLAYAARRMVLPLLLRVNGLYAAKTIEEADPTFKNSLITYLDLRASKAVVSKGAMA